MRPYTQVPQHDPDELDPVPPSSTKQTNSRLAGLRLFWLAAVLCCGGALFGYDSGVIGQSSGFTPVLLERVALTVYRRGAHL